MSEQQQVIGYIIMEEGGFHNDGHAAQAAWENETGGLKYSSVKGSARLGDKVALKREGNGWVIAEIICDFLEAGSTVVAQQCRASGSRLDVLVKGTDGKPRIMAAECGTELMKRTKNRAVTVEVVSTRPLRLRVTGIVGEQAKAA